jgi:hypothetical protein
LILIDWIPINRSDKMDGKINIDLSELKSMMFPGEQSTRNNVTSKDVLKNFAKRVDGVTLEDDAIEDYFISNYNFVRGENIDVQTNRLINNYTFKNKNIEKLLDLIVENILSYVKDKTSSGIIRAELRRKIIETDNDDERQKYRIEYSKMCDELLKLFYESGNYREKTRPLTKTEIDAIELYVNEVNSKINPLKLQHIKQNPVVFIQYGTGCPFMDIAHIKSCEAWGADGVVHFDPSWGARTEGLFEGYITHEEDGSVITYENLKRIKNSLNPYTLWQVRAHRGLNTPETVLLAGKTGADLTKINIAYGSLGGGTDPERLTVDAVASLKYAAEFGMPYDVVTNEELCGVPAYKAFAGMLIVSKLGLKLGAKPILQPLFCLSPEVMVSGQMEDNYVDFNAAKILCLRNILDAPIWCGAPIGFLTQTEDRVQSSLVTALHAALASLIPMFTTTFSNLGISITFL